MRITIIHGQNHKQTTYHMGRLLIDKLGEENEVVEFFLPRDFNQFCIGCYQCLMQDPTACPHYYQLEPLKKSIEQADLLIFTTPLYCLHASASMKALLDHCFSYFMVHQPRQEMFKKKAVIMSASAGSSAKGAIKDIKDSLSYWGISDIYSYTMRCQAMQYIDINENKKVKMDRDMKKLAVKIIKHPAKTSIKTKALFYVMRFMQLKDWSVPQDKVYWQQKGWLGKVRPWK